MKNLLNQTSKSRYGFMQSLLLCTAIVSVPASGAMAQEQDVSGQEVQLEAITVEAEALVEGAGDNSNPASTATGIVPKTSEATKSSQPIEKIAQTISVVTSTEMEQREVQNSSEALRYQAGVSSELYGADPRSDWIRVRGYQAPEYLDGLKMARGTYAWPRVDPFMLESIEVLRGPSGSLYGQTPPGGMVNQVSKLPRDETHGEVQLQFRDPRGVQYAADFGGPVEESEIFSYRLTGVFRNSDTVVEYVEDDRFAVSGALKAEISDQTNLTLLAHNIQDDSKAVQFLPALGTELANPNGDIPRERFTGEPDFDDYRMRQNGFGYLFNHKFDDGPDLSHKLRYSRVGYDLAVARAFGLSTGSTTTVDRRAVYIKDVTDNLSADTNLKEEFRTGDVKHQMLVGFDYLKQKSEYSLGIGSIAGLNLYNPTYGAVPTGPGFYVADQVNKLDQVGLYVQDEMSWNNWVVNLRGRQDWFESKSINEQTQVETKTDDRHATWGASLLYAFDNGISPYVSTTTSFEPLNGVDTTTGEHYKPTESDQLEFGIKYAPTNMNALFTTSVFHLQQENTLASNGLVNVQIGKSEVRGVEFEARSEFENGIGLFASYAYSDSEITEGDVNRIGNELPFVPEHQANAEISYMFGEALDGLKVSGGVRYFGASYGDQNNTLETDGYTLFDAGLNYDLSALNDDLDGMSFNISAANLFDKVYVSSCNDTTACYYGAGRTIRGSLAYKW